MRERVAMGALAFAVVSPSAYLVQRLVEHWLETPVDPLALLRQVHTAFYWRCATSAWWGSIAAIVVMWGARAPRIAWSWSAFWAGALVLVAWQWP